MLNKKALAASVSAPPAEYVEDVFSTYLYTGTGATQTITNNIDLSTKGGMVWIKTRSTSSTHYLFDTVRGTGKYISSNTDSAEATDNSTLNLFNTNGFRLGADSNGRGTNISGDTQVSWTFRKQAKFFDVVTYTGNGTAGRTVAHNLGSVPGMIIIKRTSGDPIEWVVYHRSLDATSPQNYYLRLNTTAARTLQSGNFNDTAPTSSVFTLGNGGAVNTNGETYVAYLFAHNAGGFGTAGTDNIISCGSFTTDGSGLATVTLGYEPQFVLWKQTDGADNWYLNDIMRGMSVGSSDRNLSPNTSGAESAGGYETDPTATGFIANPGIASKNYIYMAIRRPMKTPTSGTEVFSVTTGNFTTPKTVTTNFPVDLCYSTRTGAGTRHFNDRLRGGTTTAYNYLGTNSVSAESTGTSAGIGFDNNTAIIDNDWVTGADAVWWNFKRAPGFFDQVCYTGNSTAGTTISHNLGVVPELIIIKARNAAEGWPVYSASLGNTKYLQLNSTGAETTATNRWNDTSPTSSVFTLGTSSSVNFNTYTYVAYLFATVAGVSKVGSYTGTGSAQTINCGFTAGARFVMIKCVDAAGGWYIYDTARGIVSGNDPFLFANTSTAQTTNTDYIDPANSGFEISSTAPADINGSGNSFIFLAIA